MSIVRKIKRTLRGEVAATAAARELLRRSRARLNRRRERARLSKWQQRVAQLRPEFAQMSGADLLDHFRNRSQPVFLPGFSPDVSKLQKDLFPEETKELITLADRVVDNHSWPQLGIGEKNFGKQINWHRDPVSEVEWPLEYHADLNLFRSDGSDVRVLWELNRLPHLLTLARAFAVTKDERFTAEFFAQVESWHSQNPYGMGANWNCAMEVALRATNLLGAFEVFRNSPLLNEQKLARLLSMFDQHGAFIRRNLEFSYVATSNHYLSDVVGLVWLGTLLPELKSASEWREFGWREMLREMDKQVLADGAHFESSTGYHRFVLELFLYTFILCRANNIQIDQRHWDKLRAMLYYVRAYLRPDGRAPLIGDSDSGQFFPITKRSGDDHGYLLAVGGATFDDASLKLGGLQVPEESLWVLGEQGVTKYEQLQAPDQAPGSQSFPNAGIYILRDRDLYLLFNASDAGINGRGSHGHNDALSIEVSACGRSFIVDPGTYVYSADLEERHRFRSTAYHSTVQIDGEEQNTITPTALFIIGNEANPRVLEYEVGANVEVVTGEHYGFRRLPQPVTHQRRVAFNKQQRYWFLLDKLTGEGEHDLTFRFHFSPGLETGVRSDGFVEACDSMSGVRLLIAAYEPDVSHARRPEIEARFSSCDYGAKQPSVSARWSLRTRLPFALTFVIVPVCAGEDEAERLTSAMGFED